MRKFLRLLMLVLMVAYGSQGWGAYVKFKGNESWSGTTKSKTNDGVTINLTLANGTFSKGYLVTKKVFGKTINVSTGESFWIPSGSTFTVSCSTAKIVHIAFSFDNGVYPGDWDNYSNDEWSYTSGHLTDSKKGHNDYWSQSYWYKDDNDDGVSSISFTNNKSRKTCLLWMYVYYVKNSDATSGSTVKIDDDATGAVLIDGVYRFENSATFNITSSSKNDVYYTTDGSTPTTSSTKGTSGTVSESCVVTARTYTTFKPNSDNDGDDKPAGEDVTVKQWYSDKKVFTRYYKRNISSYQYTTLCFPTALKVPSGCTAATYGYSDKKATIVTKYSAGSFIPANTPVLVYSQNAGDKELDWVNTYNGESAPTPPSSSTYCLEGNPTGNTVTPTSDSNYKYFGLMAPTAVQKERGLGFGFYQFNYDGTCGAIPAYRAYLKVLKTDVKANAAKEGISFEFFDDDNNTTTGISVVPTTLDGASGRQGQSAVRYNLSGQQVGPDYKGIVIVNGRKMVVK